MTKQADVVGNDRYISLLDHGFVGLVDHMGSDAAIVEAARVSYGAGTKTVREDRGLIRYLFRHGHSSPVEMCEVKLHIKAPIFVFRQLVRHRTASLNEQSGRYSVMADEFYKPTLDALMPQSSDNKQGRSGELDDHSASGVDWLIDTAHGHSYDMYKLLLGEKDNASFPNGMPYDPYDDVGTLPATLPENFPGIAREIARGVLPVSNYSELYWKQDLHNLFHLLRLRLDPHAQYEIRVYADAIYKLIQPLFPAACEAFEDYRRNSVTLSRMETELLQNILASELSARECLKSLLFTHGGAKSLAESYGMTVRELGEFTSRLNLSDVLEG